MQSDPQPLDLSPSPATPRQSTLFQQTPARPNPSPTPREAAYTPRTVWQTPDGLAPTFSPRRGTRNPGTDPVAVLLRRCLRLTYRLRRLLAERPVSARRAWAHPPCALAS